MGVEDTIIPPLGETDINALPRAVVLWKLSPLRSAVVHPKHTVQQDPIAFSGASLI